MSYAVAIGRREAVLRQLQARDGERIRCALHALSDDPRPPGCRKLSGREGWRLRVGDYRVIYGILQDVRTVEIVHIDRRSHVYRR